MSPEDVVHAVFQRVQAADPSVSELFAEDAVRYGHDGQVQRGRAAIAELYRSRFGNPPPPPQEVLPLLVHLPFVGALVRLPEDVGLGEFCLDLFEIEDGQIRSLRVLLQGGPRR